jgi:hypothetical protein
MYATYLYISTAIGFSKPAGYAAAAVKIRYKSYCFAYFETRRIVGLNQFARELMSQNPWITKKRLGTFKCMQVGTTNANTMNFDNGMFSYLEIGFYKAHIFGYC